MGTQTTQMQQRYSEYKPTGNNAIDLIAEAVGYHKFFKKPIKEFRLSRQYYRLFKVGMEVLGDQIVSDGTMLTFDNIPVMEGLRTQMENIKIVYFPYIKINTVADA